MNIVRNKIIVKPSPPYTAGEECRMLNAKVEAARYVLERTRRNNIYQQRLDELYPNYIEAVAMWLAGLSIERIGFYLDIRYHDVKSIIRLYNLSNETR